MPDTPRPPRPTLPASLLCELAQAYAEGPSAREVAAMFECSPSSVVRAVQRCGGRLRSRSCAGRKRGGSLWIDTSGHRRTRDRDGCQTAVARACWEAHCGSILEGTVIHHIDGNPVNDDIGNFACLSIGEHLLQHRMAKAAARRAGGIA